MTSVQDSMRLRCKDFIEQQFRDDDMDALLGNEKHRLVEKFKNWIKAENRIQTIMKRQEGETTL